MKKYIVFMVLFFSLFVLPVHAEEGKVKELIPIENPVTVKTEKFTYHEITFVSTLQEKELEHGVLNFGKIENNTMSRSAISFNILLFDIEKKNIGYISYCSDKDPEKVGTKISGKQSMAYSIPVLDKYYTEGNGANNVKYLAVYDENRFCHEEDPTQYAGETLEEILGIPSSPVDKEKEKIIDKIVAFFTNPTTLLVLMIVGALLVYIVFGLVINALRKRMYGRGSFFCFFPITNYYICVKLAFGKIIAIIFIVLLFVFSGLVYFHIWAIYAIPIIILLAFILDIIKLITKNYDLLFLEPSMKDPLFDESDAKNKTTSTTVNLNYDENGIAGSPKDDLISSVVDSDEDVLEDFDDE